MSVSVTRAWQLSLALGALAILGGAACRRAPNVEQGQRRLAGSYTYFDRRGPDEINSNFNSASLELHADGTALQTCEFKDGKRYQSSGAKWNYDGDGNVSIDPLKDCSWVNPLDRDGPLEVPKTGASLIVEWGRKPVIVMHPDINAFYEHK